MVSMCISPLSSHKIFMVVANVILTWSRDIVNNELDGMWLKAVWLNMIWRTEKTTKCIRIMCPG